MTRTAGLYREIRCNNPNAFPVPQPKEAISARRTDSFPRTKSIRAVPRQRSSYRLDHRRPELRRRFCFRDAAEQPSIEDVVLGAIPGLPKVHLHNPVLAYEVGDDFMKYFYQAERGETRSLRAGGGRLNSQRRHQSRRLLGGDGH